MFNQNSGPELTKPQYNSTLKIIKQIEDVQASTECNLKINDSVLEKINEKASSKLNFKDEVVFDGLIKIKPAEEDFLRFLQAKHGMSVKPQINSTKVTLKNFSELFSSGLILLRNFIFSYRLEY